MIYVCHYDSPLGGMILAGNGKSLAGLWFEDQKNAGYLPDKGNFRQTIIRENGNTEVFECTKKWMELYFSGKNPDFTPLLNPVGSDFQLRVWRILLEIPYGSTTTYGTIARAVAGGLGVKSMSAQAVGRAIGHNPISILIPCHRVVGADGTLTGYAGGLPRKRRLLEGEGIDVNGMVAVRRTPANK